MAEVADVVWNSEARFNVRERHLEASPSLAFASRRSPHGQDQLRATPRRIVEAVDAQNALVGGLRLGKVLETGGHAANR